MRPRRLREVPVDPQPNTMARVALISGITAIVLQFITFCIGCIPIVSLFNLLLGPLMWILDLVAVVTVGLLYMLWTFTNKRFDLERQEQDELVGRIDELQEDLLKLEGQIDALRKQVNERG